MKRKQIRVRAPNGFRVRYRVETHRKKIYNVYCELYDQSNNGAYAIGNVELVKWGNDSFATHSTLDPRYWNKGLGTLIYAKAIAWALNHGYKVRSSGGSSDMAKRMWNGRGIRQLFDIQKRTRKYTYNTAETWYAYPKGELAKRRKKGKRK
jgi:GNAT superfamily N-acetyltransferase